MTNPVQSAILAKAGKVLHCLTQSPSQLEAQQIAAESKKITDQGEMNS